MLKTIMKTDNGSAQLFIRIALGIVMFPHGAQKVFGWFGGAGFWNSLQAFAHMGFPAWSTVLLMMAETLGAVLLVAGFLTRISALAIGVVMSICVYMNHVQHGFFMNWFNQQKGEGFEYHILVLGIVLALLLKGGGVLSVDRAVASRTGRRSLIR